MAYDVPVNPTPRVIAEIIGRLRNRPELAGVRITRSNFDESTGNEILMFLGATDTPESRVLSNLRVRHSIEISCELMVARDGNSEEVAVEAQERAYAILREIDREVRGSTAGATLTNERTNTRLALSAKVGPSTLTIGSHISGQKQGARLEFVIEVQADTARE